MTGATLEIVACKQPRRCFGLVERTAASSQLDGAVLPGRFRMKGPGLGIDIGCNAFMVPAVLILAALALSAAVALANIVKIRTAM